MPYEYDDRYQLVHEHRTAYGGGDPGVAYEYNFAYDAAGNRTSWQVVGGTTTNYTYDAANKMTSPGTFAYDGKGNTLTHTIGGVTTSFACIGAPFAPKPSVESRPLVRYTQREKAITIRGRCWHDIYADDAGMLHVLPHSMRGSLPSTPVDRR